MAFQKWTDQQEKIKKEVWNHKTWERIDKITLTSLKYVHDNCTCILNIHYIFWLNDGQMFWLE